MNAKTTAEQRKDLVQFRIATKALKSKVQDILDDLESAESRIRALEDVVRELVAMLERWMDAHTLRMPTVPFSDSAILKHKALALLSEGATGEGK